MTLQECLDTMSEAIHRAFNRITQVEGDVEDLRKANKELRDKAHQLELANAAMHSKLDFISTHLLAQHKPYPVVTQPTQPNPQDTQWTVNSTNPDSPSASGPTISPQNFGIMFPRLPKIS